MMMALAEDLMSAVILRQTNIVRMNGFWVSTLLIRPNLTGSRAGSIGILVGGHDVIAVHFQLGEDALGIDQGLGVTQGHEPYTFSPAACNPPITDYTWSH